MTALVVALLVAVALLALLVAGLLRSHAEILRQLHALGAGREDTAPSGPADVDFTVRGGVVAPGSLTGTPGHDLVGVTPASETVALPVAGTRHDTLIAFLSSGCLTCQAFWTAFGQGGLDLPDGTRLVVVTKGEGMESPSAVRDLAPAGVPLVMSSEAWDAYGVPGSPYFVLVDGPAGRVRGEGSATSWDQVRRLVGEARADRELAIAHGEGEDRGDGAHREARADRELESAGITPGHPSLYATADEVVRP